VNISRSHRIRLFPTKEQERFLQDCAFVARTAWNFGLSFLIESNRRVIADWNALSDAERLARDPALKPKKESKRKKKKTEVSDDKKKKQSKPKVEWASYTDDDRLKRAPTGWDSAPASAAWTQVKKTSASGQLRGAVIANAVPAMVGFNAFIDLNKAWNKYFKECGSKPCSRRKDDKNCWCKDFPAWMGCGHPRFKNRSSGKSFLLPGSDKSGCNAIFGVDGKHFVFTGNKYHQRITMAEELRFQGRVASARVFEDNRHWYASIQVMDITVPDPAAHAGPSVGVDLGVASTATLSTGEKIDNLHAARKNEPRIAKLNQAISLKSIWLPCPACAGEPDKKKECKRCSGAGQVQDRRAVTCEVCKGTGKDLEDESKRCRRCRGCGRQKSQRMIDLEAKITKLQQHAANQRNDHMHKATTRIVQTYSFIGLEDINFNEMKTQNAEKMTGEGKRKRGFQRSLTDACPGEFRRQLEYKAPAYGGRSVRIDKWSASSKICSACGERVDDLPMSVRTWTCPVCGVSHDRDINAAVNILRKALDEAKTTGEQSAVVKKPRCAKKELHDAR